MSLKVEKNIMQAMPLERAVADFYGVHPDVIYNTSRKSEIVKIKQIVQWLWVNENIKHKGRPLWSEIKKHYRQNSNWNIHHRTIMYSFRVVNNHIETEKNFREEIYRLQKSIFGKVKYY